VLFSSGFLTGYAGFGAILIALPFLLLLLDPKTAITLSALATCVITITLAVLFRRHLDYRKVLPLLLGAIPGVPLGVWGLHNLDRGKIQTLLGVLLIVYPLIRIGIEKVGIRAGEKGAYVCGFCAGTLGGCLGVSGPPVIIYTLVQPWTKDQIKATLLGFFALETTVVASVYGLSGMITPGCLTRFGVALPMVLLGTFLGAVWSKGTNDENYRRLMLILMPLLGLLTIWRGFALPIVQG
jgi:uncharacterized membrane protein YfcA